MMNVSQVSYDVLPEKSYPYMRTTSPMHSVFVDKVYSIQLVGNESPDQTGPMRWMISISIAFNCDNSFFLHYIECYFHHILLVSESFLLTDRIIEQFQRLQKGCSVSCVDAQIGFGFDVRHASKSLFPHCVSNNDIFS